MAPLFKKCEEIYMTLREKYIYSFSEGNKQMDYLLGEKGANISEAYCMGLPIPEGFIVSTKACGCYLKNKSTFDSVISAKIDNAIRSLELKTQKKMGYPYAPLILSVRISPVVETSGLPGSILNLGLSENLLAQIEMINSDIDHIKFLYDLYQRFIRMYSTEVKGISDADFRLIVDEFMVTNNISNERDFTIDNYKALISLFKKTYQNYMGEKFPDNLKQQLYEIIKNGFDSWLNPQCQIYLKQHKISQDLKLAVIVQCMVFGNLNLQSGCGHLFTRDPNNGQKKLFEYYAINAQEVKENSNDLELCKSFPEIYNQLIDVAGKLEKEFEDMLYIDFVFENSQLYILDAKKGRRSSKAEIKIAVDFVEEGYISIDEAIKRVKPETMEYILNFEFDGSELQNAVRISSGISTSDHVNSGKIYFSLASASEAAWNKESVILVTDKKDDLEDSSEIINCAGLLTSIEHAIADITYLARYRKIPYIYKCTNLSINMDQRYCMIGNYRINEGEYISLDGLKGLIYLGNLKTQIGKLDNETRLLLQWADMKRKLGIKVQASSITHMKIANKMGVDGVGLMRIEEILFEKDLINHIQSYFVADSICERNEEVEILFNLLKNKLKDMYSEMSGKPISISLLDCPLSDLFPLCIKETDYLVEKIGKEVSEIQEKIDTFCEFYPDLGLHGVRVSIAFPELLQMQLKAIVTAALETQRKYGTYIIPEIIVPMVSYTEEVNYVKESLEEVVSEFDEKIRYKLGAVIETPRALLLTKELAAITDFLFYDMNDLTTTIYGMSQYDRWRFITDYIDNKIYIEDPFVRIDEKIANIVCKSIQSAHEVSPGISIEIYGNQTLNPPSVDLFAAMHATHIVCSTDKILFEKILVAKASVE